jgi:hypothetical protein
MSPLSNWPRNRLLLALPSRHLSQLLPELEHIRCQPEQVLMDADSSLDKGGLHSALAASDVRNINFRVVGTDEPTLILVHGFACTLEDRCFPLLTR